jgi:hypothetical protein
MGRGPAEGTFYGVRETTMDVPRISVEAVRRSLESGSRTLLVCGYDGEDRFRDMELEGSISWESFQSRLPALPPDQEIVFYCA